MSSVSVKICGLSTPETLEATLEAGADMVGFVSFPRSPRHLEINAMAALAEQARGRAEIVVLTVDADDAVLKELNSAIAPDWFQLHGAEDAARIDAVRTRFAKPIMKAVGIGTAEDVAKANALAQVADRLLLDAKPPKGATRPGGLGAVFDWSLLDTLDRSRPFMLSGGLAPETVADAIMATGAPGVDVSSGVESAPGIKDIGAINAFIEAAKTTSSGATATRHKHAV